MIEVKGLDVLDGGLDPQIKIDMAKRILAYHGAELERTMKDKARFTKGYSTGFTRRFINTSSPIADKGMSVMVAPNSDYAAYLELGTRFMSAQSFVQPSLEIIRPKFLDDLRRLGEIK